MRRLTIEQARRYALTAQGLADPRPSGRVDVRHFRKVADRLGVIQLDSVNAFSRAHYMPFFTRLGAYDRDALDGWLWGSGEMFEYWGHMASLLPTRSHRLFRWRMDQPLSWNAYTELQEERPGFIESVLDQVKDRGPIQTSELEETGDRLGRKMWNWNAGKIALEALFADGKVTTAARPGFVRLYDLTERVIPAEHLAAPGPGREEAQSELLLLSAGSLGVATADDLADYYRIRMPEARPLIEKLAENGELVEVEVEGWDRPGYLHPDARSSRRAVGPALVSPFDNLIWHRDRVERLWEFYYRIEIYVPEPKRVYGYYVLPFLFDGDLVARVDLKTDRKEATLRVRGAFAEPGVDRVAVGRALREELELVASWLGMERIDVAPNGDLAGLL